jgi:rubrerythrin
MSLHLVGVACLKQAHLGNLIRKASARRQKAEVNPDSCPLPSAFCLLPSSLSSMLTKLIARLGLINKHKFIRFLAKIEYGNAVFIEKLQQQAVLEDRQYLASFLEKQAKEENKHGKMLSSLADGGDRITRIGTGRWVTILREKENLVKTFIKPLNKPKVVTWDSKTYPGEKLTGILENFDGMSHRFLAARLLFQGQDAFSYPWEDRIAFMYVLEEEIAGLYLELALLKDADLSAIASQMAKDEFNHANYLKDALCRFTPFPEELLNKWRKRVRWAKWGMIFDAVRFFI